MDKLELAYQSLIQDPNTPLTVLAAFKIVIDSIRELQWEVAETNRV